MGGSSRSAATEIRALAGPATRVEDLGGAAVVPGLIDAHNHLQATGRMLREVQLYDTRAIPEIVARVATRVRRDTARRVGRRARLGREPSRRRAPSHPPRPRCRLAGEPGRHPPRLEQARLQLGGAASGGNRSPDTRPTRRRALQRLIRARRRRRADGALPRPRQRPDHRSHPGSRPRRSVSRRSRPPAAPTTRSG